MNMFKLVVGVAVVFLSMQAFAQNGLRGPGKRLRCVLHLRSARPNGSFSYSRAEKTT